jgi:hypothetical protein
MEVPPPAESLQLLETTVRAHYMADAGSLAASSAPEAAGGNGRPGAIGGGRVLTDRCDPDHDGSSGGTG